MSDRGRQVMRAAERGQRSRRKNVARDEEKTTLSLHLHRATPEAVLVSDDGDEDGAAWLPLSLINVDECAEEGEVVEIGVPEWLARREGLI